MSPFRFLALRFLLRHRRWLSNPRGTWSRFYLACVGVAGGRHVPTYGYQEVLPPLPLPSLSETCRRYLRSVRPLLTHDEYEQTVAVVSDFRFSGGVGAQLQSELKGWKRARTDWFDPWWTAYALLAPRASSLEINWYRLEAPNPSCMSQVEAAARVIADLMAVKVRIDTQTLEPQRLFGTVPICMHQFSRVFSTCKVPGIERDRLITYDSNESKHVIIAHRNHFYRLGVYDVDGGVLTLSDLKRQLEQVIDLSYRTQDVGAPVGILTTQNRTWWAEIRQKLLDNDPLNQESISAIEKALFVVCLDEEDGADLDASARAVLHGNGRNRWFDKSFQVIVLKNGQIGQHVDHAAIDGSAGTALFELATANDKVVKEPEKDRSLPLTPVTRLGWKLTPEIEADIHLASRGFDRYAADLDLKLLVFDQFGKGVIKDLGLSPDGFVQMAFQLAYYKLHRQFAAAYEPATTRLFFHGHSETIRSCSEEAVAFVTAMARSDCPLITKRTLLRKAVDRHAELIWEAMSGRGVDRHLYALRIAALEAGLELPEIFRDKAYGLPWRISTSQISMEHGIGVGFWWVESDGYGIGYCIKEDAMYFHISTKVSSPGNDSCLFTRSLTLSLNQMRDVCQRPAKHGNSNRVEGEIA